MAPSLQSTLFFNSMYNSNTKRTEPLPQQQQKIPKTSNNSPPHNWKSALDPKTGRTYYYHSITKKTTWDKPIELQTPEEQRIIKIKEQQKRDFFSAMETNVRRNLELGLVPGCITPPKKNTKVQFSSNNPRSPDSVRELDSSMVHLSLEEFQKLTKPSLTKRNTCGTVYLESTMTCPDKDNTINGVCSVILSYIISSPYKRAKSNHPYYVFNDETPSSNIPSLNDIASFYKSIFYKAQMESDCIIMSLIYIDRLMTKTKNRLRPCRYNWKSLLFSSMILASKVWDDLSMWNADFSQTADFSLKRINQLEIATLKFLNYNVKVTAKGYALYYFELRELEWDGKEGMRLEKCSARFQENVRPVPLRRRSKSEVVLSPKSPRVNLEQVVNV